MLASISVGRADFPSFGWQSRWQNPLYGHGWVLFRETCLDCSLAVQTTTMLRRSCLRRTAYAFNNTRLYLRRWCCRLSGCLQVSVTLSPSPYNRQYIPSSSHADKSLVNLKTATTQAFVVHLQIRLRLIFLSSGTDLCAIAGRETCRQEPFQV